MFVKDNFTGDLVDGWKRALSESSFEQMRRRRRRKELYGVQFEKRMK